jgi:hypothetical protein
MICVTGGKEVSGKIVGAFKVLALMYLMTKIGVATH